MEEIFFAVRGGSMKVNFHTIEFMSAEAGMGVEK